MATFREYRNKIAENPASDPISLFYYVVKAKGGVFTPLSYQLSKFCVLYLLSLDLFDDMQDNDLAGKPHEKAGPAIAVNNALTLFALSSQSLLNAIELESDNSRGLKYFELFNRISITAANGQYRDLVSANEDLSSKEVLRIHQAKTSSIAMITECAAISVGCDEKEIGSYRRAGEKMTLMVQIVDDVRDIFGKQISPDLKENIMTYPVALFLENGTESQKNIFFDLKKELPDSLEDIRSLLYDSGTINWCAEMIEQARTELHGEIAATKNASAAHRMWLHLADTLAGMLYEVPLLASSRFVLQPKGEWYDQVEKVAADLVTHLKDYNPPQKPLLIPWHLREWMYYPQQKAIYYADIEGQPEEILPIQATLLDIDDISEVETVLKTIAPITTAHEFFHYWRDKEETITKDSWFEEWAVSRLTIAYVKAFYPDLSSYALGITERIINANSDKISPRGEQQLEKLFSPDYKASKTQLGYEFEMKEIILIQFRMGKRLYEQDLKLDREMSRFLQP